MKTIVTLPVPHAAAILVAAGDDVTLETIIAQSQPLSDGHSIPLAELLNVSPPTVAKFLKKRIDEQVGAGDVIACKRSMFSSSIVRSPASGKIQEINLVLGTVTIGMGEQVGALAVTVVSPVSGTVRGVTKTHVDIEVHGAGYPTKKGEGNDIWGRIECIDQEHVDTFAVKNEVAQAIVLCKTIAEDAVVKLEALGALGLILLKGDPDTALPWAIVDDEVFSRLSKSHGKQALLRPKEKQIVVTA